MYSFLRKIVAPEVIDAIKYPRIRFIKPAIPHAERERIHLLSRKARLRRNEERALICRSGQLLPPAQGNRRPEFCSQDDIFWTNPYGDIPNEIVQPRKSIWTSFK